MPGSMKRASLLALTAALSLFAVAGLVGCGGSSSKEEVLIYTSVEDYVIEDLQQHLDEQFPDYDVTVEYMPTGNHAAKLLTEGSNSACDITYDLEYTYMAQLDAAGVLVDLADMCDFSIYEEDIVKSTSYLPQCRNGGAIIVNMDVIADKDLDIPQSYEDLLDPQYEGLISMPNPKSSGTGYMFYLSLAEAWGDEAALDYFEKLTPNVLQYTESGSGPVNALLTGEVAIGLGMTGQAVTEINEGANFQLLFFEEGSPYSMYGQGIVSGHEDRQAVLDVFNYLYEVYGYECNSRFFPEKIFKDKTYEIENYPTNIAYADMSNDTAERKEALLALWEF